MEKIRNIYIDPNTQSITHSSGTLTLDLLKYNNFIITLEADLSSFVIENPILGKSYNFTFIQNAIGGWIVIFPVTLDFSGDLNIGVNEVTVYTGIAYNSTSLKGGAGSITKASQAEAEAASNDVKYLTPNAGYLGWLSWVVNKTVSVLNTTSKNIVGSINELLQIANSKVARKHIYADIGAMIVASAQETQIAGELIRVEDASDDPNIDSGVVYYDYKGSTNQSINDYYINSIGSVNNVHTYDVIRYIDTVNGDDTNNGQYNTPYKTIDVALTERVLPSNLDKSFNIRLMSGGIISSVTFDGTGVTEKTFISGIVESVSGVLLDNSITTLNITDTGVNDLFFINCPPTNINYTQTGTNYCSVHISGGVPSTYLTISSAEREENCRVYYYNINPIIRTTNCQVGISLVINASLSLVFGSSTFSFRELNLSKTTVLQVGENKQLTVSTMNIYGGGLEINENASFICNASSYFRPTYIKKTGVGTTITLPVGITQGLPASLYHEFDPSTSSLTKTNVQEAIVEAASMGSGGYLESAPSKTTSWAWSDGVDSVGGGTYLDFVIIAATDNGEIGAIGASMLFVNKVYQIGNYTIESTNFVNDTIRIEGAVGDELPSAELDFIYNKQGVGYNDVPEAPLGDDLWILKKGEWLKAYGNNGEFSSTLSFDSGGRNDDYTLLNNETWNISNIEEGLVRVFNLITEGGFIITKGANIANDYNNLFGVSIPSGVYRVFLTSISDSEVDVSVPQLSTTYIANLILGFHSVQMADDNTYVDITFNKGMFGANDGVTALLLTSLLISFSQGGGTATAWTPSSIKKPDNIVEGSASALTGGEIKVRVFGATTGDVEGSEQITITPNGASSIFDVDGNAVSASQSGTDGLNLLPFDIASLGTSKLLFWGDDTLEAANIVHITDPGYAESWVDKSGNNAHAVQTVLANKLTVTTDGLRSGRSVDGLIAPIVTDITDLHIIAIFRTKDIIETTGRVVSLEPFQVQQFAKFLRVISYAGPVVTSSIETPYNELFMGHFETEGISLPAHIQYNDGVEDSDGGFTSTQSVTALTIGNRGSLVDGADIVFRGLVILKAPTTTDIANVKRELNRKYKLY